MVTSAPTAGGPAAGFESATLRRRLGEPTRVLGGHRGEFLVWARPERGIVVTSAAGHGGAEIVPPFLAVLDDAVAHGARAIWDDWARVTSYDSQARLDITAWTRRNEWIARDIHVLVGSKLVAMGLTLGNLAVGGGLQVTTNRHAFERGIEAQLLGR